MGKPGIALSQNCGSRYHDTGIVIFIDRHLIALERGTELHLFEGIPEEWTNPGMVTSLEGVYTRFGILSVDLKITGDGKKANITIALEKHNDEAITNFVVHTNAINNKNNQIVLTPEFPLNYEINLE